MTRSIRHLAVLVMFAFAIGAAAQQPTSATSAVPAERLERLTRGINLSHWMAQTGVTPERIRSYITAADARRIRRMGFRHVRLTVDGAWLMLEGTPSWLPAERLALFDEGVRMMREAGLAVIVDIHPEDDFKRRLRDDPAFVDAFVTFWKTLATHLDRTTDPEWVFLEVLNEPVMATDVWQPIQRRVVKAMRAGSPRHTIIVSGGEWSSIEQLQQIQPLDDPNIVYNFHFYEPGTFTHQGANWGYEKWQLLRSLPYPSTPENVEPALQGVQDDEVRWMIRKYGEERWNAERIRAQIEKAVEWSRAHGGLPLTCNEFGTYATYAPRMARLNWLRDVREALEAAGIGWAMWDYAGGFGVVTGQNPATRRQDGSVVQSLGLWP